jgi:hypothetical protein
MITLILFGFFIIVSLATLFIANIHGVAGAIILGLNALAMDIFWQWLRMRIVRQMKSSGLVWAILGGLAARVLSIILFVRLGLWWLGNGIVNTPVSIFAIILFTLPVWSIIASNKFKSEGN